ncbi:MAG: FeoB-associated Cys-rich membrane protein [Candidatus Taylorbacteria bacterium]|nr:FeoB-associated Cys-rich membrane protein [Candidatus Taylorbacteria bacterium]
MSTWSSRRKYLYAFIVIVVLALAATGIIFSFFYEAPSCTDNKKNGDEQGIDCGGSCTKLCSNAFLAIPSPSWVRFKEVGPKLYNIAAYIVNPNKKAGANKIPYHLSVLNNEGFELASSEGIFDLPPGRNTMVFIGGLRVANQVPVRAIFEFTKQPEWVPGVDTLANLDITDKNYRESTTESSLDVTLRNRDPLVVRNVAVYAILKDKDGNVLDFSRTIVDEISSQGTGIAPFTWPVSHLGKVISLEVLAVPE